MEFLLPGKATVVVEMHFKYEKSEKNFGLVEFNSTEMMINDGHLYHIAGLFLQYCILFITCYFQWCFECDTEEGRDFRS